MSHFIFLKTKMNLDAKWSHVLSKNEDGRNGLEFEELRQRLMTIHKEIHWSHKNMIIPFDDLAIAIKTMLDPMIQVLKMFIKTTTSGETDKTVINLVPWQI